MIWIGIFACSDKAAQVDTELGYQVIDSEKLHDSAAPTDSVSPTEPELMVLPTAPNHSDGQPLRTSDCSSGGRSPTRG